MAPAFFPEVAGQDEATFSTTGCLDPAELAGNLASEAPEWWLACPPWSAGKASLVQLLLTKEINCENDWKPDLKSLQFRFNICPYTWLCLSATLSNVDASLFGTPNLSSHLNPNLTCSHSCVLHWRACAPSYHTCCT